MCSLDQRQTAIRYANDADAFDRRIQLALVLHVFYDEHIQSQTLIQLAPKSKPLSEVTREPWNQPSKRTKGELKGLDFVSHSGSMPPRVGFVVKAV
jgi:hypothetical protein